MHQGPESIHKDPFRCVKGSELLWQHAEALAGPCTAESLLFSTLLHIKADSSRDQVPVSGTGVLMSPAVLSIINVIFPKSPDVPECVAVINV